MDPAQLIAEFGFPGGMLMVCLFAFWRTARFSAPLVTKLTDKHCELIDSLKTQGDQQTRLMAQQGKLLTEIHREVMGEK